MRKIAPPFLSSGLLPWSWGRNLRHHQVQNSLIIRLATNLPRVTEPQRPKFFSTDLHLLKKLGPSSKCLGMSLIPFSINSRTVLRSSSLRRQLLRHPPPCCQVQRLNHSLTHPTKSTHPFSTPPSQTHKVNMSSTGFSNTSTGDAPADPYKAKNKDEPSLEEKIETLNSFVSSCKFGMMTTWNASSKLMASRCMAVAAKVYFHPCMPGTKPHCG